ncbi:uncharacterized protein LOC113356558 [Papaver somniferum]|uniref:uncharacterized protein LOC113356558 n=1 Tax=Papaver somniferum TaxID=3469 RepID=UPI000E7018A6|nr:uncharacterized protein LOC113356558 [Papaver somniferum]
MEGESSTQVGDLVKKFKQEVIDLGDTSEIVVISQGEDKEGDEETKWEASAISKIITERRMKADTVAKHLGFTWPFMKAEDVKITKTDPNIMIFKLSNWTLLNTVINERPWSINKNLLVVHDYIPGMVYTKKNWGFQQFWMHLFGLMPEHVNVAAVTKIGELMGQVISIEPKDAIPNGSDPVKVCVNIGLTNLLRRGVKAVTNAGLSRWIKIFYERQPSGICKECYVIKYCKVACKEEKIFLEKAHEKPYLFGNVNNVRKTIAISSTSKAPTSKKNTKALVKTAVFVPPKSGVAVNLDFLLSKASEGNHEEENRLGKRQRADDGKAADQNSDSTSTIMAPNADSSAAYRVTTGDNQAVNAELENQYHKNPFGLLSVFIIIFLANMKILSWNVQGSKTSSTRNHLTDLIRAQNPDIIFLCETKISSTKCQPLLKQYQYPNWRYIEPEGLSGGLVLLWKNGFLCEIIYNHYDMFNAIVQSDPNGWVNSIVSSSGLEDIGFIGKGYTWSNNNMGTGSVKSRIDMALVNGSWNLNFPDTRLLHLTQLGSDHSPIMLDTDITVPNCWKPFKFFLTWLNDESCSVVITNDWKSSVTGSPGYQLVTTLSTTRRDLSLWNIEHFGNINHKVDNIQSKLNQLQELPQNSNTEGDIININNELNKWHKIKSEFYQQKSRDHFTKDMESNNKYFHTKVNKRRTRNNIDVIQDNNNNWLQSREQIAQHLTQHFKSISTTNNPVLDDSLYTVLPSIVIVEQNALLTRIPSNEEIFTTLKSMENWSSPSPKGFQDGFFKS